MFKHLLSSIGIDGMTVDTLVNRTQYDRNEPIEGVIHLKRDDHRVNRIELTLIERIANDDDSSDFATYDHILEKVILTDDGSDRIHFKFSVPDHIKSLDHQFVIVTQAFIEGSIDAHDEDYIQFV